MTIYPQRHLLMVATQCRSMARLDALHDAARLLSRALLDPAMGNCQPTPALPSALLGGRPHDDRVTTAEIWTAIKAAIRRAADDDATLVLAFLGHGFTPGSVSTLYMMGADSENQRHTAVDMTEVLTEAVDTIGINGVIAIVDTCGAAAAMPAIHELSSGVRAGRAGLALLAAAGAKEDAYDLRLSRTLAELMDTGLGGKPAKLDVVTLKSELARRIGGQRVTSIVYDGTLTPADNLWLSHNRYSEPSKEHAVPTGPVERPDDKTYRYTCERYLRWAINKWSSIEFGDLGLELDTQNSDRIQRLPLEHMYISLQADPRSLADRHRAAELRRRYEAEFDPDIARTMSANEHVSAVRPDGSRTATDTGSAGGDGISLEDAFARHRILVVLGHPGSGKSVMCQWLGWRLSKQSSLSLQSLRGLRYGKPDGLEIPLKFRAADYAKFYATQFADDEKPGGIAQFLAYTLSSEPDLRCTPHKLQGMFERALADGEAVILIDGLDELTDRREEVIDALVDAVETCVTADSTNRVVVTSRIAGYDDICLTVDGVATYLIRPMSEEQSADFVSRFFDAIQAKDQAPLLLQRLASSNETIRRLATTPLLLASMCSYWQRHHELPA